MEGFAVRVSERDGFAVVHVAGDVDVATAPQLRNTLLELIAGGHSRFVLDMAAVEFLDSSGLGAIVAGLKRVRAHDGDMRVVCATPRVVKVFSLSRIDRIVAVYPTLDDALVA